VTFVASRTRGSVCWVAVLAACIFLTACRGSDAALEDEPMPFETAFAIIDAVSLKTAPNDPVGFAAHVVAWNGRIAVVDKLQSNIKVFDTTGTLVATLGRPGRGPGEYRVPESLAVLSGQRLAVLDATLLRITILDSTGTYLHSWTLPGFVPGGLVLLPVSGNLLIPMVGAAPGSAGAAPVLRVFSEAGDVIQAFGESIELVVPLEGNFTGPVATAVGGTIVWTWATRNEVFHRDEESGRTWAAHVGQAVYRAPDWPKRASADREAIGAWGRKQMWVGHLLSYAADRYLLRFNLELPNSADRLYAYALASVDGQTLGTVLPSRFRVHSAHDDELLATAMDEHGDLTLVRLRVRTAR
jgi:hypothetical protein